MPNRHHRTDPRLLNARIQVQAFLDLRKIGQQDLAIKLGIKQSQVSRFLSGQRKRVTPAIISICRYANYEITSASDSVSVQDRISQVMHKVLCDNPAAADVLARILESIAPLVAGLSSVPLSTDTEAP